MKKGSERETRAFFLLFPFLLCGEKEREKSEKQKENKGREMSDFLQN